MDSRPLFTIVTVTLNNLEGLQATAASVRAQRYVDYEWWIVDGGSKDGTLAYLTDIADSGTHYSSSPDEGIFDAMNKGLERASGRFVIFMNAGDQFADENVLLDVAGAASTSEAKLIYGDSIEDGDGPAITKRALPHRLVFYSMFTHHQAMFYDRESIAQIGYDLSYAISADWAMTARLLAAEPEVLRLDRVICIFERGGVSQSQRSAEIMEHELRRMHSEIFVLPLPARWVVVATKLFMSRMRLRQAGLYRRLRSLW